MAEEFKEGDVVQLKSGGSIMTIEYLNDTEAGCIWFEGSECTRITIPQIALKKYEAPSPSSFFTK